MPRTGGTLLMLNDPFAATGPVERPDPPPLPDIVTNITCASAAGRPVESMIVPAMF